MIEIVKLNKMKRLLIVSAISVLVVFPVFVSAQSQKIKTAANKSWSSFWTKFSVAVKTKNRQSFIALTSKNFTSGGGETVSEWLEQTSWTEIRKSVAKGTKPNGFDEGKIWRITKDNNLIFVFENGRWGFFGQQIA
jgi:hypothetical protein